MLLTCVDIMDDLSLSQTERYHNTESVTENGQQRLLWKAHFQTDQKMSRFGIYTRT